MRDDSCPAFILYPSSFLQDTDVSMKQSLLLPAILAGGFLICDLRFAMTPAGIENQESTVENAATSSLSQLAGDGTGGEEDPRATEYGRRWLQSRPNHWRACLLQR
jgi:hypothetical protein